MRRIVVLVNLVAIGGLSIAVSASQQPPVARVLEAEKLRENLFVIRGANSGGNTAVFVGSAGVVVVDTKIPGWGPTLLAKIKDAGRSARIRRVQPRVPRGSTGWQEGRTVDR